MKCASACGRSTAVIPDFAVVCVVGVIDLILRPAVGKAVADAGPVGAAVPGAVVPGGGGDPAAVAGPDGACRPAVSVAAADAVDAVLPGAADETTVGDTVAAFALQPFSIRAS